MSKDATEILERRRELIRKNSGLRVKTGVVAGPNDDSGSGFPRSGHPPMICLSVIPPGNN